MSKKLEDFLVPHKSGLFGHVPTRVLQTPDWASGYVQAFKDIYGDNVAISVPFSKVYEGRRFKLDDQVYIKVTEESDDYNAVLESDSSKSIKIANPEWPVILYFD